ncbi:hypothetical protein IMZ31_20740 (plasmid) [Pontibacillus sp. ALD_SL1]|uniref:hypothetical protein n=1 Tax=Pontibacillus sp. ALD_SL1 TaxID=2777185 RepID=UPI001A974548|nr:hypothetical protein [Pontibacillus sp. ALD_SL1]QST02977.1 hypothetical protein IMZ31_20740 [Pontibacillus sp. ALD_SL1]
MKNLLTKFMQEERGDVVQYIIVLAVIAIILAFAFPTIKDKMSDATAATETNMNEAFGGMGGTSTGASTP